MCLQCLPYLRSVLCPNWLLRWKTCFEERQSELKAKAQEERRKRQERGEGDEWEEKQHTTPPRMNDIDGFKIEMWFKNDTVVGSGWYHGTVQRLLNPNTQRVRIKWDRECLGENDPKWSNNMLKTGNWNPKKPREGSWREYFTK